MENVCLISFHGKMRLNLSPDGTGRTSHTNGIQWLEGEWIRFINNISDGIFFVGDIEIMQITLQTTIEPENELLTYSNNGYIRSFEGSTCALENHFMSKPFLTIDFLFAFFPSIQQKKREVFEWA